MISKDKCAYSSQGNLVCPQNQNNTEHFVNLAPSSSIQSSFQSSYSPIFPVVTQASSSYMPPLRQASSYLQGSRQTSSYNMPQNSSPSSSSSSYNIPKNSYPAKISQEAVPMTSKQSSHFQTTYQSSYLNPKSNYNPFSRVPQQEQQVYAATEFEAKGLEKHGWVNNSVEHFYPAYVDKASHDNFQKRRHQDGRPYPATEWQDKGRESHAPWVSSSDSKLVPRKEYWDTPANKGSPYCSAFRPQ